MKTVLVVGVLVVAVFFATLTLVRLGVGFIRYARKHRAAAGEWLFVTYCRDSLGNWVDDVSESPSWFPHEGHHHGDPGAPHDGHHDASHGDSISGD